MEPIRQMLGALMNNKPLQAEEAFHRAISQTAIVQLEKLKQSVGAKMCRGKK